MPTRITAFLIFLSCVHNGYAQEKWGPPFSAGYVYTGFHEAELSVMLNFINAYTPQGERDDIDPGSRRRMAIVYSHGIVFGAGYVPREKLATIKFGYQYTTQQELMSKPGMPLFFGRISGEAHTDFVHWVPSLIIEMGLHIKIRKIRAWNGRTGFMGNSAIGISAGVVFAKRDALFGQRSVSPLLRLNWVFGKTYGYMFRW
jgi:hypothetical protein